MRQEIRQEMSYKEDLKKELDNFFNHFPFRREEKELASLIFQVGFSSGCWHMVKKLFRKSIKNPDIVPFMIEFFKEHSQGQKELLKELEGYSGAKR